MIATLGSELPAAEICRRNGWERGTRLVSINASGERTEIRITAVGDARIFARQTYPRGEALEWEWHLSHRDWQELGV